MVAQTATAGGQAQKRYRPAPPKTFQCRGYGECRMVFSRSEHLARHIRKHTGERPFSCHCGKQFSRLDNLRQHAQTVHADKQDQNEQMMRDLTTLHATMAAANKGGGRTGTSAGRRAAAAATTTPNATTNAGHQVGGNATKQEDMGLGLGLSLRPGTSTGYEGDMWASTSPSATAGGNHSFRDSREASQISSLLPSPQWRHLKWRGETIHCDRTPTTA
ncbi:hypothetical protein FA13DRAFT_1755861 [Coprinellus micaceus]|uniref:C2H2-type domain-containing protein n=1 Tax=Coprinellus micaceus TaxID=71717 RepID=A0A4Y7T362_COPMI|nr:hypothetical protein FA13DRAFT_1755861 [Coprinellus micaceus]